MLPNDRARYAYQYYLSKGLSPEAAAGIVANFAIESGNFSSDVIAGKRRGDNGSAHYVQQLRGDRKDNYEAFAGDDATNFDKQLDFFLEETDPSSKYVDAISAKNNHTFFNASSPQAAALGVMNHYERPNSDPKINHVDKRLSYAQALYDEGPANPVLPARDGAPPFNLLAQQTAERKINWWGSPLEGVRPTDDLMDGQLRAWSRLAISADERTGSDAQARAGNVNAFGVPDPESFGLPVPSLPSSPFSAVGVHDGVDLSGLNDPTRQALDAAASSLGRDIPVTSGYRSQQKQDRIRNSGDPDRPTVAKKSHHTSGDGVDINIKGMSEEEVSALVATLADQGFAGFGYYGSDGHLHADRRSSVPSSFNPDTGWGGWTSLPPHIMRVLVERGFRPGAKIGS